ncbi:MAG TPA: FAD-dependent oxidoreductase [Burkholderiales bacterium]|nr:FAD-dependent oxidoreductase [Burkholderiales bacterium]
MIESPVWNEISRVRYESFPQETIRADVAIVGGGVTGLSTAYHLLLRYPTLHVVVLEAGTVGSGASGRNTGMLGPGVGQDLLALIKRLGDVGAEALYRATLRAVKMVGDLIATEHIDCDLSLTGQILWARSAAGRRRLSAQADWLNARGLLVESLFDNRLAKYIRLPPRPGNGIDGPAALRLPLAGIVHPGKLVAGLARAATVRGARIFECSPVRALTGGADDGKACLSLVGGGKVIADQAVLATAGYAPNLGRPCRRIIALQLQALATEPIPTTLLANIGWAGREGVVEARRIFSYFRLSSDNRLIFGGGPPRFCPVENARAERIPARTLKGLRHLLFATFPDLAREGIRVSHGWSGTIGYVLDGLPAIGRCSEAPNILHAIGWCGHGLALGVAAGSWISDRLARSDAVTGEGGLAWFRDDLPKLPCKPLHGLAVRAVAAAMRLMDYIS